MNNAEIIKLLLLLAGGVAAFLTIIITVRKENRSEPLLSVNKAWIAPGGLSVLIRNEGQSLARDIEVRIGGQHAYFVTLLPDALAGGGSVEIEDICPAGTSFEVTMTYTSPDRSRITSVRELRGSGGQTLRIVSMNDAVVRVRMLDWLRTFFSR